MKPAIRNTFTNSQTIIGLFLMSTLLFLSSCSFDEPVLPSWSVPINIPLAEENFQLGENIINDSTIVAQGDDSLIHISFDGDLESIELSASDFTINGIDTTQSFELGNISMDNTDLLNTGDISLGTIFPALNQLVIPGQTVPFTIPDTTFAPAPSPMEAGDFIGLHILDGVIRVIINNNLPMPLGPNTSHPNGIQVTVLDSTGQQITVLTFPDVIATGQTAEQTANIGDGGTWVYAPLTVSYILPIAQATQINLTQDLLDNTGISMNAGLENLEVDEAIAFIESQEISSVYAIAVSGENRIRNATIQTGELLLNFTNNTELDAELVFNIPNLMDSQQQPYSGILNLAAGNTENLALDLAGYQIADPTDPTAFVDSLHLTYQAITEASTAFTHIRSTDNFQVGITLDNMVFESFSGFLAADTFDIDPFEEDSLMDYEDMPTNLQLEAVNLTLTLSNEVFIENMFVDLSIKGYHRNGSGQITDSAEIQLEHHQIVSGHPNNPGVSYINLDGSDVADFLNILPTTIRTSGRICASGNVEISNNSNLTGSYNFSTPLRFVINGDAIIEGDVDTLEAGEIDGDVSDSENVFESGETALSLLNATPLGGEIEIFVSSNNARGSIYDTTGWDNSLEFRKLIQVTPATVDPVTGFVTEAALSEILLNLSTEEFQVLKNAPLRIGYRLKISGTNGVVALRASDFLKISGLARVVMKVNQ